MHISFANINVLDKTLWCTTQNQKFYFMHQVLGPNILSAFLSFNEQYIFILRTKMRLKYFLLRPGAQKNTSVDESHTFMIPVKVLS